MDLDAILERIETRLEELGMTADSASKAARKPDAIRNMRRAVKSGDRRGVSAATISALAEVLDTTVGWLSEGIGPEAKFSPRMVIEGLVGAGGEIDTEVASVYGGSAPEIRLEMTVPPGSKAYEVRDHGMLPKYDPGDVILVRPAINRIEDLIGRVALVQVEDRRRFLKRVTRGSAPGLFDLESFNAPTMKDVRLIEAAPIYVSVPGDQVLRPTGPSVARAA